MSSNQIGTRVLILCAIGFLGANTSEVMAQRASNRQGASIGFEDAGGLESPDLSRASTSGNGWTNFDFGDTPQPDANGPSTSDSSRFGNSRYGNLRYGDSQLGPSAAGPSAAGRSAATAPGNSAWLGRNGDLGRAAIGGGQYVPGSTRIDIDARDEPPTVGGYNDIEPVAQNLRDDFGQNRSVLGSRSGQSSLLDPTSNSFRETSPSRTRAVPRDTAQRSPSPRDSGTNAGGFHLDSQPTDGDWTGGNRTETQPRQGSRSDIAEATSPPGGRSNLFGTRETAILGDAPPVRAAREGLLPNTSPTSDPLDRTSYKPDRIETDATPPRATNSRIPAHDSNVSNADNSGVETARRPLPFWLTLGLFASLAANLFFGWVAWNTHMRYQDLVDEMAETEQRLTPRSARRRSEDEPHRVRRRMEDPELLRGTVDM